MTDCQRITSIADGWITEAIANQAVPAGEAIDDEFSYALGSLMFEDPAIAWAVLKTISQDHRVDVVDDVFGMGPLSSFVLHHGTDFQKPIHDFWRADLRFREQYKMVLFCDEAEALISPDNITGLP
jgi:hypothetical protein